MPDTWLHWTGPRDWTVFPSPQVRATSMLIIYLSDIEFHVINIISGDKCKHSHASVLSLVCLDVRVKIKLLLKVSSLLWV